MEEQIFIKTGEISLEARFIAGAIPAGVVITHPHPLYGGSMNNNVVWTAARAFGDRGWSTLRFNFRGVGASSGSYGEGLAEVEDVTGAVAYLKGRGSGPCYVAGYSFGAAVAARALLGGLKVAGTVLISPPIAFMDLSFLVQTPGISLIVAGDRDDLCPLPDVEELCRQYQPPVELRLVSGADHFYGGREQELHGILKEYPFPLAPA
ncbi:MAG: alpha/beta fold hydrolase [Desulfobaccales bacterium]